MTKLETREKYLIMGMGVHFVEGNSATTFHFEVHQDVIPVRLFIPENVANDFLVYQISTVTTGEDGAKREDHVLLPGCDPMPAALFSSIVELPDDVLRLFKPEDVVDKKAEKYLPQYPWHLLMKPVRKGDQIRLGVTNMNFMKRYIIGAFLVVPSTRPE